MKKIQVPVLGGLRKVIRTTPPTSVGTTIAEFGTGTVTLAQLKAALGISSGGSGSPAGGTFSGFAAPTALVALTAKTGTVNFAMRADAAPALDQSIAPTWTGDHIFAPASGNPITTKVGNDNISSISIRDAAAATHGTGLELFDSTGATQYGWLGHGTWALTGAALADIGLVSFSGNVVLGRGGTGIAALTMGPNGNITVSAPTSGVAHTVNAVAGSLGIDAQNGVRAPVIVVDRQFTSEGDIPANGSCVVDEYMQLGAGKVMNIGAGGVLTVGVQPASYAPYIASFLFAGQLLMTAPVTIYPSPFGGTALTVNSVAGGQAAIFTGDVSVSQQAGATGANLSLIGSPVAGYNNRIRYSGGSNRFAIRDDTSGVDRIVIDTFGDITITAPSVGGGVALTMTGLANSYTQQIHGAGTSGQSLGLLVEAGTTSADTALFVLDQTGAKGYFKIVGDGTFDLGYNGTGAAYTMTGNTNGTVGISSVNAVVAMQLQNQSGVDGRTVIRFINPANTQTFDIGVDTSGGATLAFSIRNITNGGTPFAVSGTTDTVTIGTPLTGNAALIVNGVSGTTPAKIAPAGVSDHSLLLAGITAGRSTIDFQINGVDKAFLGINNAAGDLIAGSGLNDLVFRAQGTNIDFSTDSGSHIAVQLVAANGGVIVNAPTASVAALTVNAIAGSLGADVQNGIRSPATATDRQPAGEGDILANSSVVVDDYMLLGAGQAYNIGTNGTLSIGLNAAKPAAFTPTIPTPTTQGVNRQPSMDIYLPPTYNLIVDEYIQVGAGLNLILDNGATFSLGVQAAKPTPTNGIF